MGKITYEDKENLDTNPSIPEKNKVTAENMNEIKEGINELDLQLSGIYVKIIEEENE